MGSDYLETVRVGCSECLPKPLAHVDVQQLLNPQSGHLDSLDCSELLNFKLLLASKAKLKVRGKSQCQW